MGKLCGEYGRTCGHSEFRDDLRMPKRHVSSKDPLDESLEVAGRECESAVSRRPLGAPYLVLLASTGICAQLNVLFAGSADSVNI